MADDFDSALKDAERFLADRHNDIATLYQRATGDTYRMGVGDSVHLAVSILTFAGAKNLAGSSKRLESITLILLAVTVGLLAASIMLLLDIR